MTPTKASGAIGVASVAAFAFWLPAVGNMYEVLANAKLSQAMYICLSIGTKRQHTHHSILRLSRSFSLYHFISLYRRPAVTAKGTHIVNICWEHVEAPSIGVMNSMSIHVI